MIDNDKEKFAQLLKANLNALGRETGAGVIGVWWESLKRFDYQDVLRAFSVHVQDVDTGQYAPKPADIIRIIEGGSTESRAFVAWSKVFKAISMVGGHESVVFDDKTLHAVIDQMGGWIRMCEISEDETPFVAKEFQTRYRGLHKNPGAYPAKLIGRTEHSNRRRGFDPDPPVLIGDPVVCQRVLSEGSKTPRLQMQQVGQVAKNLITRGIEHAN